MIEVTLYGYGSKNTVQFLGALTALANFLSLRSHSRVDVLRQLVTSTLNPLEVRGILIYQIGEDLTAHLSGHYGVPGIFWEAFPLKINVSETHIVSNSFNQNKILLETKLEISEKIPVDLDKSLKENPPSLVAFPVTKFNSPAAIIVILKNDDYFATPEEDSFLLAVSSIFALHMFADDLNERIEEAADQILNKRIKPTKYITEIPTLSERQEIILKLISQKLTNFEISDAIGYSESTVRQETVRIFSLLNCSNRYEAAQIYINLNSKAE